MSDARPSSLRAGATLLLLATFTLGMIAGASLLHIARWSLPRPPGGGPPPPGPPLHVLEHELDLSQEQVEKLRAILDDTRLRMRTQADATRDRIRELLTPAQRERFERMRPPPPPPPPPPPGGPFPPPPPDAPPGP